MRTLISRVRGVCLTLNTVPQPFAWAKRRRAQAIVYLAAVALTTIFTLDVFAADEQLVDAWKSFDEGRIDSTISRLETRASTLNSKEQQGEKTLVLAVILRMCADTNDAQCLLKHLVDFERLERDGLDSNQKTRGQPAAFTIYYTLLTQLLYGGSDELFNFLDRGGIGRAFTIYSTNIYTEIDAQLLAARAYLFREERDKARIYVDRALARILNLTHPSPRQLAEYLLQVIELLYYLGDREKAAVFVHISGQFIDKTISPKSVWGARLSGLAAQIVADTDPKSAPRYYRQAADRVSALEIDRRLVVHYLAEYYNALAALCAIFGDFRCADDALREHPAFANRDSLIKDGAFTSRYSLIYAVVDSFVNSLAQREINTKWQAAMKRVRSDVKDRMSVYAASISEYAVGLSVRNTNELEAKEHMRKAARLWLQYADLTWMNVADSFPLPGILDRVILGAALSTFRESGGLTTADADLAVRAGELYTRNLRNVETDALRMMASQPSSESEYFAHSNRTLLIDRMRWEREALARVIAQAELLSSGEWNAKRSNEVASSEIVAYSDLLDLRQEIVARVKSGTESGPLANRIAGAQEVQSMLKNGEAIVTVAPFFSNTMLFVCVRNDSVNVFMNQMASPEWLRDLDKDVKLVQYALTEVRPPSDLLDRQFPALSAVRLYDAFVRPVEGCLKKGDHVIWTSLNLTVVPPHAFLKREPKRIKEGYDLGNAEWLAKDYIFSYPSSITGFVSARTLAQRRSVSSAFLAVADPIVSSDGNNVVAARGSVDRDHPAGKVTTLAELPDTNDEAQGIAKFFPGQAKILLRTQATKARFRQELLSEYNILHFATHGLIRDDLEGIGEAALVLTPEDTTDSRRNGLLTASEISKLKLNAKLVVLSACNTANFDIGVFGTGVQGLTTAFHISGVPSVLATLWSVDSAATKDIIIDAYSRMTSDSRESVVRAVQAAMVKQLANTKDISRHHPRFWAPFVVMGDGATIAKVPNNKNNLRRKVAVERIYRDKNLGEVYSIVAIPNNNDVIIAGTADWNGRRSASLVQRLSADGTVIWSYSDREFGVSGKPVVLPSGVYVPGYISNSDGEMSARLLRLGMDGTEHWVRPIGHSTGESTIINVGVARSHVVAAIMEATSTSNVEENKYSGRLVEFADDGRELRTVPLPIHKDSPFVKGAVVRRDSKIYVFATLNIDKGLMKYRDDLAFNFHCGLGFDTVGVIVNEKTFAVEHTVQWPDVGVRDAVTLSDGALLVGGQKANACKYRFSAGVWSVNKDLGLDPVFEDDGPFTSHVGGIVPLSAGAFSITVSTSRSVAKKSVKGELKVEDYTDPYRYSQEDEDVMEASVIDFSGATRNVTRTNLNSGAPLLINGAAASGGMGNIAIGGAIDHRAVVYILH